MSLIFNELLLFPIFTNLNLICIHDLSSIPNGNNSVSVPLVAKYNTSLLLYGNLTACDNKCSFAKWTNFIHFTLNADAQMCSPDGGSSQFCNCEAALCRGDTIALRGPTGRYGNLQIPYSVASDRKPPNAQWDWLEFCRDYFTQGGTDVVCRQLSFDWHDYSSIELQTNGLELLTENTHAPFMLPHAVDCDGTESTLAQCKFRERTSSESTCSGPLNIYCKNARKIRLANPSLTGSTNPEDSELLVFLNSIGRWSTVCAKNWTAYDNTLACEAAGQIDPFDRAQARSCWEHTMNYRILDWTGSSGYYLIYSEQLERVIPVHCDMETDQGGWTLVLSVNSNSTTSANWNRSNVERTNRYDPDPVKDYSILELADSFQVGDNPEFLVAVEGQDGSKSSVQVQYPKRYSMCSKKQETEGLVLVNQVNVSFDLSGDSEEGGTNRLGMPWIRVAKNNNFTALYTMQSQKLLRAQRATTVTTSPPTSPPTTTAPLSYVATAATASNSDFDGDSGVPTATVKPIYIGTFGVLAAENVSDRIFDPNIPGGRVHVFVRTKNYKIKEPPLVDCTAMDYLLDGNAYHENASFTSSSLLVYDPANRKEPYYNLNAHNSFIAEPKNESHGGGAWVAAPNDQTPWVSVDLLVPHKLKAVIMGAADVVVNRTDGIHQDTWVTEFTLESKGDQIGNHDGRTKLVADGKVFTARAGAKAITTQPFPIVDDVRFVRLYPRSYQPLQVAGTLGSDDYKESFGLRWELVGCSQKPRNEDRFILYDLGDEALGIKDSIMDYRLGSPAEKIWLSPKCTEAQFQVRFQEMYLIRAIVVAGHPNHDKKIVSSFRIMFSKTGSDYNLQWYGTAMDTPDPTSANSEPREFFGPSNGANAKYISFTYPWSARLIRFVVSRSPEESCYVRLEFIGRPMSDGCLLPLGMASGEIADFQLSSSSQYALPCASKEPSCMLSYGPGRARYGGVTDKRGYGAWRPSLTDEKSWIAVNFRHRVQINAVIIDSYELSYVSSFILTESDNGTFWHNYTLPVASDMIEEFATYKVYYLSPPIYTRHLRIHPKDFGSWTITQEKNVRFELLGCIVAKEIHSRVPQFSNFRHMELTPNKHYDSYWYNHTNVQCAERCLNELGFVCLGFYYDATLSECILTASNQNSWDVEGHNFQMGTNFYEREVPCSNELGLKNPKIVLDSQFSASSSAENYNPPSARLLHRQDGFYAKGWRSSANETTSWLQIDMIHTIKLTGLHINGDGKGNYVSSIKLMSSFDQVKWMECCVKKPNRGAFDANNQTRKAETIWLLPDYMEGRYFRIFPLKSYLKGNMSAFQMELIGCIQTHKNEMNKYSMALASMKCTGKEEKMEDCQLTASDPGDKHCKLETAVRPKCLAHCGDPGLKACATRTGLNFFHPNTVNYTCLDGTFKQLTCGANAVWSSPGVSCVKDTPENVAHQKSTYQSSTARTPGLQVSSKAVDNDVEKNLRTCSVTRTEINPWWYVDLGHVYEITEIHIFPSFEFQSVEIRVGMIAPKVDQRRRLDVEKNPFYWTGASDNNDNDSDPSSDQTKPYITAQAKLQPIFGQFVSIQIPTKLARDPEIPASLSLCEVRVIAKPCMEGDLEDQAVRALANLSSDSTNTSAIVAAASASKHQQTTETTNVEQCKRTQQEMNPYWIIMPGGQLYVSAVTLWTAKDAAGQLQNFEIRVGEYARKEDLWKNRLCYKKIGWVGLDQQLKYTCQKPLYGSYVVIQVISGNSAVLSLCDVQVWGRICHTVTDATLMHPLFSSLKADGPEVWVLMSDENSCFRTKPRADQWVALDLIFPTEMYKAQFTLCDDMVSGNIDLRVGDNEDVTENMIMMSGIHITSEQSKFKYDVEADKGTTVTGRYFSIHFNTDDPLQSLCICSLNITRDRYCPKEQYHNVAFGLEAFATHSPNGFNATDPQAAESLQSVHLTTDGDRQILRQFCYETINGSKPYWKVTLHRVMRVYTIRLTGRQNSERIVRVGSSSEVDWRKHTKCDTIDKVSLAVTTKVVSCVKGKKRDPLIGDVVTIEANEATIVELYLCEVEVWGYIYLPET